MTAAAAGLLGVGCGLAWTVVVVIVCAQPGEPVGGAATVASMHRPGLARVPAVLASPGVAAALAERGLAGEPVAWAGRGVAAAFVLAVVGAGVGGAAGVGALLVVGTAAALVAARVTRGRGGRLADECLPALLDHTGRGVRSGLDLRTALADASVRAGPHRVAVETVVARIDGGASWDDALGGWVRDAPRTPVQLVAAALGLAAVAGGRATVALDGIASTLRARRALAQEASAALASQAKASAAVLVALPMVVAGGGAVADPRLADALLGTSWGLACLAGAVVLDTIGALWMQRIVTASVR